MKGWLRLGILFLIITSCIVVVNASAKSTSSCGKIVYIGETVDVSACVSSTDTIGWWSSPSHKNKASPDSFGSIEFPESFYVLPSYYTGTYYNVDTSTGFAMKKVFTIQAPN